MDDLANMRYGPFERKYPGQLKIPEVEATFLKPNPDLISSYMYKWRSLIVDEAGYYYPKEKYAKNGYIFLYDTTGIPDGRFILKGMFPTNLPSYNMSYDEDSITKLTIKFNVDTIERL